MSRVSVEHTANLTYNCGVKSIQNLGADHARQQRRNQKEFEAQVRDAVHAAGRKMAEDVMTSARATNLFLDGARAFLNSQ